LFTAVGLTTGGSSDNRWQYYPTTKSEMEGWYPYAFYEYQLWERVVDGPIQQITSITCLNFLRLWAFSFWRDSFA